MQVILLILSLLILLMNGSNVTEFNGDIIKSTMQFLSQHDQRSPFRLIHSKFNQHYNTVIKDIRKLQQVTQSNPQTLDESAINEIRRIHNELLSTELYLLKWPKIVFNSISNQTFNDLYANKINPEYLKILLKIDSELLINVLTNSKLNDVERVIIGALCTMVQTLVRNSSKTIDFVYLNTFSLLREFSVDFDNNSTLILPPLRCSDSKWKTDNLFHYIGMYYKLRTNVLQNAGHEFTHQFLLHYLIKLFENNKIDFNKCNEDALQLAEQTGDDSILIEHNYFRRTMLRSAFMYATIIGRNDILELLRSYLINNNIHSF